MDLGLSEGTLEAICARGEKPSAPVLQVQGYRLLQAQSGSERYRLMLTDGVTKSSSVMLATQLNSLVSDGRVSAGCVVRVDSYSSTELRDGRRLVLLLALEVLRPGDGGGGEPFGTQECQPGSSTEGLAAPSAPPSTPQPRPPVREAIGSPTFSGRGPTGTPGTPLTGSPARTFPISNLNPYQNRWTIRARITSKSDIRRWSNSRGEGRFFSIDLQDESGEIRAIAFNEECDKYYEQLQVNQVYYLSRGVLKAANKQFSTVRHDYEVSIATHTVIRACDEAVEIPVTIPTYTSIAELPSLAKNALVDVIGVCQSLDEVSMVQLRNSSRELARRNIRLVDASGKVVTVTLWGQEALKFVGDRQPVVAIRGARVSDFGGCSLSVLTSSSVQLNPDMPPAFQLRSWYDRVGAHTQGESISDRRSSMSGWSSAAPTWKTFAESKDENLGQGEQPDYFTVKGTVLFVKKENYLYQACPSADCSKKVVTMSSGKFRCERCDRETTNFKFRLFLQANLADFSDNQWVTCFHETSEVLLGDTAERLGALKAQGDDEAIDRIFHEATFRSYMFRLRVKAEHYNDEMRLKAVMMDTRPLDHRTFASKLIADIRRMTQTTA
ncbi:replication protein A 70 kDa DNA-binding subunit-like [Lampetra fluviatilis]